MNDEIIIFKKNNVYAVVKSVDRGLLMSIYDKFSIYVKGYKRKSSFRRGIWDGKIHLYNINTGEILLGLVNKLIEYCFNEGISVKLGQGIAESFIGVVPCVLNNDNECVKSALSSILNNKRRIIKINNTEYNPSIIYNTCYHLINNIFSENENILIILPSIKRETITKLKFRMLDEAVSSSARLMVDYSTKNVTNQRVIFETNLSLITKPPMWYKQFRCVIVENTNLSIGKTFVDVLKICEAEYRICLSNNNVVDDANEYTARGLFGSVTKLLL